MKKEIKKKTKVKRSKAGLGLFADEAIKKGEFVIEYVGKILTRDEADRKGGKYLFEISSRRTVDGSSRSNVARYINHSCKPNCEIEIKKGRILVYALKSIKTGDELNYDYDTEYFDEYIKPYGCKCGSCLYKKNANG